MEEGVVRGGVVRGEEVNEWSKEVGEGREEVCEGREEVCEGM